MDKLKEQEERKQKNQYTMVLSLMNELMMNTGANTATDYDGVNNWDDIILYLKSHVKNLPNKGIADNYVVQKLEEKIKKEREPGTLKQMLFHGVECELSDAVRSKDMKEIEVIHKMVSDALDLCEDYREDLMEILYEHRAKVLSKVLDVVKGLVGIISEGRIVKIKITNPWDDACTYKLMETLQLEFPDLELNKIMGDIYVESKDGCEIGWNWVG